MLPSSNLEVKITYNKNSFNLSWHLQEFQSHSGGK